MRGMSISLHRDQPAGITMSCPQIGTGGSVHTGPRRTCRCGSPSENDGYPRSLYRWKGKRKSNHVPCFLSNFWQLVRAQHIAMMLKEHIDVFTIAFLSRSKKSVKHDGFCVWWCESGEFTSNRNINQTGERLTAMEVSRIVSDGGKAKETKTRGFPFCRFTPLYLNKVR